MNPIEKGINALNEQVGYWTSFLMIPLLAVVAFEVFMRYAFNSPTSFVFELTMFIYGIHYMLGLGYTYKHNTHVCIDVILARLPKKPQAAIRIFSHLVLYLPTMGLLAVGAVLYAADSWVNWERASTSWAPALYPQKTIMAIGFILILLQGFVKIIEDWRILRQP